MTTDNWRVNCISFIGVRLNIYTVCIFQHKQRGFSSFSFLLSLFLLLSLLLQIYAQEAQAGSKWLDIDENEEEKKDIQRTQVLESTIVLDLYLCVVAGQASSPANPSCSFSACLDHMYKHAQTHTHTHIHTHIHIYIHTHTHTHTHTQTMGTGPSIEMKSL